MQSLVINAIFFAKLMQALCWMLVHSLWLGLALTVLTGSIVLCTKKQTAALRYHLLTGALLLFTIAVITVFIIQLTTSTFAYNTTGVATGKITINANTTGIYTINDNDIGFTGSLIGFFNDHAALVVWCWFLIIVFRCVQFAGGLYKIKQIKTTRLTPVNEYWNQRLTQLSAALKIRGNIQLIQSGLAKMPMVVGHFKPVILFPLGLITSLPAEEVEAVLLHELAHIRRKDYLVNLLQHFTEIIFFFNPAVLWVSSLIKAERENCCDDIAVAHAGNKRNYINALVSFQEFHLHAAQYATALGSDKNQLLQRVKRMLYNNNKTLNNMEKTFLAVCFVATTSLAVLFTTATTAQTKGATVKAGSDTTISIADRLYNPADFAEGSSTFRDEKVNGVTHTLALYKRNGTLYEIYDDITSFKINGKTIPKAEWGKYEKLISELRADDAKGLAVNTDSKEEKQKLDAESLALLAQLDKLNAENGTLQNQDTLKAKAEQMELLAELDMLKQDKIKNELLYSQSIEKFKAEQLEPLAQQDKFNAEQQQLLSSKTKKEKEQFKREQEKFNAEQQRFLTDKKKALQKQSDEFNKEAKALKVETEKKNAETLTQKLEAEKDAQAARDEQQAAVDEKQAAKDEEQAAREEQERAIVEKQDAKNDEQVRTEKRKDIKKDKRIKREERKERKKETVKEN